MKKDAPKTIGQRILELTGSKLGLRYSSVALVIRDEFPGAQTTAKSVASVVAGDKRKRELAAA